MTKRHKLIVKSKVKSQKSKVKNQKSKVKNQKSKVKSQKRKQVGRGHALDKKKPRVIGAFKVFCLINVGDCVLQCFCRTPQSLH